MRCFREDRLNIIGMQIRSNWKQDSSCVETGAIVLMYAHTSKGVPVVRSLSPQTHSLLETQQPRASSKLTRDRKSSSPIQKFGYNLVKKKVKNFILRPT